MFIFLIGNSSFFLQDDLHDEQLQSPLVEQNDDRHAAMDSIKQEGDSRENVKSGEDMRQKISIDSPQDFPIKAVKIEEPMMVTQMDTSIVKERSIEMKKEDADGMECNTYIHCEAKPFLTDDLRSIKDEIVDHQRDKGKREHSVKDDHLNIGKGTVEIIDQDEGDMEMEDLSSPVAVMESDAVLKQRVAEMRLEFGDSIGQLVKIENDKYDDVKRSEDIKCEVKSDDNASIDEFDVEAQMKKITGDDGNDYKEKIDSSSERDKSMDGIEGLMESSKEDSESEDKEIDDAKYDPPFEPFDISHKEKLFKEFASKPDPENPENLIDDNIKESEQSQESQAAEQPSAFVTSSEESIFESASSNMDAESIAEPPKIFHSIPPLSERIRKKTEATNAPKSQLNFEAAIIESTIDMETVDGSKNGEEKSMLSTALRELLEAKLDDLPPDDEKEATTEEGNTAYIEAKSETSEQIADVQDSPPLKHFTQNVHNEETTVQEEDVPAKEMKRLKDPRTVVPNSMPAPAFKPEANPPVKRKVRIIIK